MDLGRTGVWSPELRYGDPTRAAELASELEALGYSALWVPGGGAKAFPVAASLLGSTGHVVVATGIVSVWECPAPVAAREHAALTAAHPGRFLLGLGVSHALLVDRHEPGRYRRPVVVMTAYLDALDQAGQPATERVLAALGPRLLGLAGARSAGAHPYLVSPDHTELARRLLGREALLAPEQAVVLQADASRAREIGRAHLAVYLQLPNYVNEWRRLGYTDDDFVGGGSDRLVDGLIAWGDLPRIIERLQAHHDAGADHVCVQVLGAPPMQPPLAEWRLLADALR